MLICTVLETISPPTTQETRNLPTCVFSIIVYEIQGKYISRYLFQCNSVSRTEKYNESKINTFSDFHCNT